MLPAMKALHPLALALVLCGLASSEARAQRFVIGGWGDPPRHGGGMHGGHGAHVPIYIDQRDVVVVEREVVREVLVAPPPPPEPPPPSRKPYVVGSTYASLPGGCMKMIEAGGAFYYCGGDWYRQVGRAYRAVEQP
jgi:hypothetical protein